jgi:hypothetical protein
VASTIERSTASLAPVSRRRAASARTAIAARSARASAPPRAPARRPSAVTAPVNSEIFQDELIYRLTLSTLQAMIETGVRNLRAVRLPRWRELLMRFEEADSARILTYADYALMYRKDDPDFTEVVERAFQRLSGSREIVAIYDRWFRKALPSGIRLDIPMSPHLEQLFQAHGMPTSD